MSGDRRRAAPSDALFRALHERYGIDAQGATDLGGSANLNLLVGGTRVVRVYRPHVDAARLGEISRARAAMAAGGVPTAEIVPADDGAPWVAFEDRLVEVERYVPSDGRMDSWERLRTGLPTLGRIHSLLTAVGAPEAEAPLLINHIEAREAVAWAARGAARIRGWGPSADEARLADNTEELAGLVWSSESGVVDALPRQVVHGDYWDNNVLFLGERIVVVLDLDFTGVRPRIDDLALTLYYTNSTFAEGRVSDERIQLLRGLVDAYDSGLDEPLTAAERSALPAALARQPLWGIGKWVALLGDDDRARAHAAETAADVEWALALMRDLERWQEGFTTG